MVTAKQRKARELFTKRAKSGTLSKYTTYPASKIRAAGSTIAEFARNLRKDGYTAVKTTKTSVKVDLSKRR